MSKENIDAPTLAKRLGKSKQAVYDMLEKDDLNTSLLRQLAKIFNVPVMFFLSEDGEVYNSEEVEVLKSEIMRLQQEINRLRDLKLPNKNDKALDVSMKFFEAAKEMFTYYNQMKEE